MKPLILSLSCLFAAMLFAMPTAQEIAAAEPLVQEVMKAEMDALRSGKKTREQVGDAAVAEDAERVNHGIHRVHGKCLARLSRSLGVVRSNREPPTSGGYV